MKKRMFGDDFEFLDYHRLCMTGGDSVPNGILWGFDCDGDIAGTFNADDEDIIGCIDAPDWLPAGAWEFVDNALMLGAFAQIVRRPS